MTISSDLSKAQKLAEIKHGLTCKWNHTDGCSWYYDPEWKRERLPYLRDAESEAWVFSDQEVDAMFDEFNGFSERTRKIEEDKNMMLKKLGLDYWETIGDTTKWVPGKFPSRGGRQ